MAGRVQLTGIIEDRYVVLDRLGIGAFGEVYRAEDERLGRQVALKRLRLEILSETDELDLARQRFIQEARVAASLRHSNIVTVHDIVSADEMLLMVLELIEGPTLSRLLKERGRFSLEESVRLLAPAAEALDHAHREGIVHRDVKPGNIMVQADGTVKVTDFGIAKIETDATLTRTGYLLGTPNYMSPEQARGETLDGRSDLFSLGCILYECLTGRRAFDGENVTSVLLKIVGDEMPPLDLEPVQPPELRPLIERALAKNRDDRFATGLEMAAAMREAAGIDVSSTSIPIVSPPPRPEPATSRLIEDLEPTAVQTPRQTAAVTERTPAKAAVAESGSRRRVGLWAAAAAAVALVLLALGLGLGTRSDTTESEVLVEEPGLDFPAEPPPVPDDAPATRASTSEPEPASPPRTARAEPQPATVTPEEAPAESPEEATVPAEGAAAAAPASVTAPGPFEHPPESVYVETFSSSQSAEFRVRPRTAILEVNGQTVGIADDWDSGGGYSFNGPGTYSVYVSSPGFRPAWIRIVVDPGAPDRVARVRMRLQRSDAE